MNYGYDVATGAFPHYESHLLIPIYWGDYVGRIGLAFGVVWVGLLGHRKRPTALLAVSYVLLVLLATLTLSSSITRVLGVLYPVLVPGFVLWIKRIK